jgi:hypothetical protein
MPAYLGIGKASHEIDTGVALRPYKAGAFVQVGSTLDVINRIYGDQAIGFVK